MIEIFIFHLHIVAALYAFVLRWQDGNAKEGLLALTIMALIFSVGWAITSTIAQVVAPAAGFSSWFTRDTLSLVLLVIPEIVIFKMFFLTGHKV